MIVRLAAKASRRSSLRGLALVGSALGSTLFVQPAAAQDVNQSDPGTTTGGPRTVSVSTASGNITLDYGTVIAANPAAPSPNTSPATGAAISATNTGTGNVTIRDVNASTSGTGTSNGIEATAQGGAISITSTGIVTSNSSAASRGILATSNGGTIAITANQVDAAQQGIGTASTTGPLPTLVTISSGAITVGAATTPNGIAANGNQVAVDSNSVILTNTAATGGTGIFVNAGIGGTAVNSTSITALGANLAGMRVLTRGAATVKSTGIRTTNGADGLMVASLNGATTATGIIVNSDTIAIEGAGRGIVLGGNASSGAAVNNTNGFTYLNAAVTSGTITTAGANGYGIYATPNGAGTTTITSNNITTTGAGAIGIYETVIGSGAITGASTINNTGALRTSNADGIHVDAGTGAVTVNNTGSVSVGGDQNYGINVVGTTGAVNIIGVGTTSASGNNAHAIYAQTSTGAITIVSGTATTTGTYDDTLPNGQTADAITAFATGAGNINITSGTASSASLYGTAVYGGSGGGSVTINSDTAITTGTLGTNVFGTTTAGDVTINAKTVTAAGQGIGANTGAGNVTVNAQTVNATGGFGISATATGGATSVTATSANGGGAGGAGVVATATSGVTLNVTAASSNGATRTVTRTRTNNNTGVVTPLSTQVARGDAVYASTTGGAINATIGSATATGVAGATTSTSTTGGTSTTTSTTSYSAPDAVRLLATGTGGAVTLASTGTLSSQSGYGLYVNTLNADLTAGTVSSAAANLAALRVDLAAVGAAKVTTSAVNATGAGSRGIYVTGPAGSTATISGGAITTAGGTGIDIGSGFGASTIAATSITGATTGINAQGVAGTLGITSGTITLPTTALPTGTTAYGINAGSSGNLTIASGTITGNAAIANYGIYAGGTGAANLAITSGTVTNAGGGTSGIYAAAGTGNIGITSGSVTASGAGGHAIYATGTTGNVTINSTSAATTGAYDANIGSSDAILAFTSTTGTGAITINSGTASAAGDYASAIYGVGGGAVSITSGTASGGGIQTDLIGGVSAQSDVSITAGTTTATGATRAFAINGTASTGNVTINAGTTSAANGIAINASAGKVATITATSASAGGTNYTAVNAVGGTGVVLNVGSASTTGANAANATATRGRADAIYAFATTGTINATIGSATATGQGADAVRLIANGTGGAVTANITGTLSSTSGYGLFIDPPGANTVTVASGAKISGGLAGVSLTGATNSVTNAGSITGAAGAGIVAVGQTTLDNAGAISGSGGTAVSLGATNDTVILRTGSTVTGAIAGGGGTDAATLIGTGNTSTSTQQVAAFTGFDNLTVQSGYWTASAPSTFATSATIASNASLAVANGATGLALSAPSIVDNGTLVVRGSSASAGSTFGASVVTGSGSVLLSGGQVTLDRTNSLQNTGVTTIDTGTTVLLTGAQAGNFINNGTLQVGNGGTTGSFTGTLTDNGTLISNRSDNYTFAGTLTGSGTFVQNGTGTVTFGTNYAFTGTTVLNGGAIKLSTPVAPTTQLNASGTGTYDLSGNNQTIAQLSGTSTAATVNIANSALTVNQSTTTSFAGNITGSGSLTVTGTGSLNLTGTNTYTGPTSVNGGRLAVNGSITSPVSVNSGGTLGGNGTVGTTMIGSGGTFAPGNSIGTTNVAGNLTFAASSIYQVEANAAGQADRVNASGTITINGGTVQVLAAPGMYNPLTSYTILTGAGVTGQFAGATSSLAFLTPRLDYSSTAVTLSLFRNDINFSAMGGTVNGAAVAAAIQSRGFGDLLYNAVLTQTITGAPVAFGQLSGEIHATIPSVLIDSDRRVRDAVIDHNRAGLHPGLGLWIQSLGTTALTRNQGSNANVNTTRLGVVGGADYDLGSLRVGINGGYFHDRLRDPNVYSRAEIATGIIGGSVAWLPAEGRFSVQGGITHAWHHLDTTRTVTTAGLAGSYGGRSTATTTQVFGEASFALVNGPIAVAPFVRYAHVWERADGFTEYGGLAALTVAAERRSNDFGSAGVRFSGSRPIADGLAIEPNLSVGYIRDWGRLYSVRSASIGGTAFALTGDRLGRDNLDANGGIDLVVKDQLRLGVSGYLTRSSQWRDYGGKAAVSFRF